MIYQVQKFIKAGVWEKDSDHKTIESAQQRAYKLVGSQDCYTESRFSDYKVKPKWYLEKGYFGTHNMKENWICRIEVIN